MKKLTKIIALLIALVMMAALVACGNTKDPAVLILGTWNGSLDLTDTVNESLEEMIGAAPTTEAKLTIDVTVTFKDDGTASFEYDTEAIANSFETYMHSLSGFIKDTVYQQLIDQGIVSSVEEVDELMSSMGYTMDEFIEATFGELDFESILSDEALPSSYVYKIENGKLYMEESAEDYEEGSYAEFTIDGDTLTLTAFYEDGELDDEINELAPLVFNKVG